MTLVAKVLGWLKGHWHWVLFPVGLFLWAYRLRPRLTLVSPELTSAGEVKQEVNDQAAKAVAEAEAKLEERISLIQLDHQRQVEDLVAKQKAEASKLEMSPEELTEYLRSVGRNTRG